MFIAPMLALALMGGGAAETVAPQQVSHHEAPKHGGAGKYLDSNVKRVWRGASHHERSVWLCIRRHESINADHYRAANSSSSARGAGQWIRSTWQGLAPWVRVDGGRVAHTYREAHHAPAWVQDAAFRHVYARGGLRMWRGTGCPGT